MVMRPYRLPDGRTLLAARLGDRDRVASELGPLGPDWELQIEGDATAVVMGRPLNSTLAALLGWSPDGRWPDWVDRLARQVEADWDPS